MLLAILMYISLKVKDFEHFSIRFLATCALSFDQFFTSLTYLLIGLFEGIILLINVGGSLYSLEINVLSDGRC